ncbi:hypothetical protein ADIWIN_2771 [Winogradskyella psychrotolerans RS-3]|uniref:Uncharacterized protein n=1 Tax=Winogradskyella psychrotolerans RS-3 TaxID=641526 RepID=S7VQL7_9FLAO|nr:hypothetical protein [Winogradskyella psychrotolerans]EPR72271.1 hypothetical protein ADIWIN_2771 [Winogradskyella psychrotolerans RS-3]
MFKKNIILFILGIVTVIVGAMLKIGDSIDNTDVILAIGLLIEIVAIIGLILFYKKSKT